MPLHDPEELWWLIGIGAALLALEGGISAIIYSIITASLKHYHLEIDHTDLEYRNKGLSGTIIFFIAVIYLMVLAALSAPIIILTAVMGVIIAVYLGYMIFLAARRQPGTNPQIPTENNDNGIAQSPKITIDLKINTADMSGMNREHLNAVKGIVDKLLS